MLLSVVALILALAGCGGALYAIFRGVSIATAQPKFPKQKLPNGIYHIVHVDKTNTYDIELIKEDES